jgi:glucose/arabinose dehydrogenase
VLRLNADGTTPADQPGGSPVLANPVPAPRALDWDQGLLWVIDAGRTAADTLQAFAADAPSQRRRTIIRYAFPGDASANGLAVYRGDLIPEFRGDLFVASVAGRALLRLRFDPADRRRLLGSERLLQDVFGPIRAVTVAPDGTLVVASASEIVRLSP